MSIRLGEFSPDQAAELAEIWHVGWHSSHPNLVPDKLTQLRTLESFEARLKEFKGGGSVALLDGTPIGFCLWRDNELYQLFVSDKAQGKGVAQLLVNACLSDLRAQGAGIAYLDCAIGNDRAMGFYEKFGFVNKGPFDTTLDTSNGPFVLRCYRYEIDL